jgi:hypothetical protein
MKNIVKKIFWSIALPFLFIVGCTDNFDELNSDKINPTNTTPGALFAGAARQMSDIVTNTNVNFNIFRLLAQQWTETTYTDESNYDLSTRNIPQNFWNQVYLDVLKPLNESAKLVPTQNAVLFPADMQNNQLMCIEIMNVYAYSVLLNTYGNIPYSKALDPNNTSPSYDDAATVAKSLATRLDKAIAGIKTGAGGFGSSDLLNGGDMAKWLSFANSLKLRLGMILADSDVALSKSMVEAAAPHAISSNSDNIAFHYLSSPPNTNPIWTDLIQSNRKDFVAANTLVDKMKDLSDPRIPLYFTTDASGGYSGGIYGSGNNFSTFSKPSNRITDPTLESIFIDYSEVEFLKAEAVERGFNVGGTAESHYNNAIGASIEYWGGDAASTTAYLANPKVSYVTATGNYKQKIGEQKWIALYNRGFDAWTEFRRLDYPQLVAPVDAETVLPRRYPYPVQEQNLNTKNYNDAAAAIGGDKVDTKLFWDKF